MAKSGQSGKNLCFCSSVSAFHLAIGIQEASGDRFAPLGKINPVEESKTLPRLA